MLAFVLAPFNFVGWEMEKIEKKKEDEMHKVRVINVLSVSSQACNGQTHNTKSLFALVRNMLMVWGVTKCTLI